MSVNPPPNAGVPAGPPPIGFGPGGGHVPAGHPWMPPVAPPEPPALPVVQREYHEFWRAPRYRFWRGLLALLMAGVLWFVAITALSFVAILVDVSTGRSTMADYGNLETLKVTPMLFLMNNLGLASAIPIAYFTAWACTGQRPRWFSSVAGRFRWGWLLTCLACVIPPYLIITALQFAEGTEGLAWNRDSLFMIVAILLTTPLQSAGEEYLVRGLLTRIVGSWLPRMAGLIVAALVSAGVFMSLHVAQDPWLNAFYLIFALVASVLVWRTGGLEAAIALHVVNNLVSMSGLPFMDFSGMFNRKAGVGDASILIQMAVMAGAAGLILWQARRRSVEASAAPATFAALAPTTAADQGPASPSYPALTEQTSGQAQPAAPHLTPPSWSSPAQPTPPDQP